MIEKEVGRWEKKRGSGKGWMGDACNMKLCGVFK